MSLHTWLPSNHHTQRSTLARPYKPGDFRAYLLHPVDPTGVIGVRLGDWSALIHGSGPMATKVLNIDVKASERPDQVIPAGTEVVCLLQGPEL
jgi:hypothetical protein